MKLSPGWTNTLRPTQETVSTCKKPHKLRELQHVCVSPADRRCSAHMAEPELSTREKLAVKPSFRGGWRLSVSPWHLFTESTQRSRPFPACLYRRESQQNGGTDKSHVTSLCFRAQLGSKRTDTTRLIDQISNRCDLITTSAVERARKIQYSPRSVVCTKEQLWRPFCTSLRRQHSSAPRHENTAKVSRQKSASNKETYRFLLLFHPRWHLWHCPVD